jgi:hypothetical protein
MPSPSKKRDSSKLRVFVRWTMRITVPVIFLALLIIAYCLRKDLYRRFVRFPKEARAWAAIKADRQAVTLDDGWTDYRGPIHNHSFISHDSMVSFEEILNALKETDSDFIFMADHCVDDVADFNWQWRGLRDGKLFVPGFEMGYGFMPFGVDSTVRLKKTDPPLELARQVMANGGLLTYAHSEEERDWSMPQVMGMDIYNTHADAMDEDLGPLKISLLLSLRSHPDQAVRLIFDTQHDQMKKWDRLNQDRKMVGFASNDCHQNQGFKGYYTKSGKLRIDDTSPETLATVKLNVFTKTLLRLLPGPLTPGAEIFRVQLDPYERMLRFVGNHILAEELTEESILASFKQGRVFISFDMLADGRGFVWMAQNGKEQAVMGESMTYQEGVTLRAASPQACRFIVIKDGHEVQRAQGRTLNWQPDGPGKYRVEAELFVLDEWLPWIYTNPIELLSKSSDSL